MVRTIKEQYPFFEKWANATEDLPSESSRSPITKSHNSNVFTMKMLLRISIILAMLGLMTFVACKKEGNNSNIVLSQNQVVETQFFKGIIEKDGVIVFEDEASIQRFFSDYNLKKGVSIENLKKQFPNFVSNYDAYENLMSNTNVEDINERTFTDYPNLVTIVTEGSDKYVTQTISNALGYLVNVRGFFQVGKTLYQVTRNEMILFDASTLKKQKVIKVEREEQLVEERGLDESVIFDACGGKRKLRGKIYKDNYGVYSESGVWTECTRKNGFYWVRTPCTTLVQSGQVVEFRRDLLGGLCSVTGFNINATENASDGYLQTPANSCFSCCSQLTLAGPVTHFINVCSVSKNITTN